MALTKAGMGYVPCSFHLFYDIMSCNPTLILLLCALILSIIHTWNKWAFLGESLMILRGSQWPRGLLYSQKILVQNNTKLLSYCFYCTWAPLSSQIVHSAKANKTITFLILIALDSIIRCNVYSYWRAHSNVIHYLLTVELKANKHLGSVLATCVTHVRSIERLSSRRFILNRCQLFMTPSVMG